ncbi:drug/metabolite transporter (DMT)-like permease [Nocardioides marinisabuli]|uniref:Drug/metabolite transporter (DMT)-like permease n=1 Tax=Nocardioides marinisabuli TaxID=419476 RepID=A0A7Y9EZY0_9ACTN|nr:hypothetical protein [Nocardioides marinisabuli]NYD57088.1 drug/metabolite transporter (DMT)-like permease [Nocardioides marinisabuli]
MPSPMSPVEVRRGGLVGILVALASLALAGFFLLGPRDRPAEALGVFVPLAVGLVALALGTLALVPLWRGDRPGTARELAWALRGIAVLGVLCTGAALLTSDLPWSLGAVAPVLVALALLKDSHRLSLRAGASQDVIPPAGTDVPPA